ncbi:single-stranded DNA-binding protein [Prevotella sp. E13-17]|uniref:single-stranded DNA-binding protein n=1 Tax=Prevotella sp. E13-17 TaxID=2913616 RepID=UPI001EDAE003|nr:single-stranded DNA-binding protein [Prevotella sp. E13-17]UKK51952.1 single-stranded DNA-binding protein [Prevotella sp. E13-17]
MNKVMLIGNVGRDPEVRYVDQGQAVARLTLATTERGYTLQNGTQVPERTEWHNVILWRKLAEVVEHYVHKGDKLYIEGRIHYASYDDKQGKRQYYTEIWADNMEMLTPRQASSAHGVAAASVTGSSFSTVNANAGQGQTAIETETKDEPLPF